MVSVNKVNVQQPMNPNNGNGRTDNNSGTSTIGIGEQSKIAKFCEEFGITEEDYAAIISRYPDIINMSKNEQLIIINELKSSNNTVEESTSTEQCNVEKAGAQTNTDYTYFDHKAFAELPVNEKFNVYMEELAKNKFMFGGESKKSVEDWNALSDEQKQELINTEKNDVRDLKDLFKDETTVDEILQYKMLKLQVDNSNHYLNQDETCYDYLERLDGLDLLSDSQKKYIENNKVVIAALREQGYTNFKDGDILSPAEIKEYAEQLGTTSLKLQIEYYESQQEKGIKLSDGQTEKLEQLKKLDKGLDALKNYPQKNSGRMDALIQSKYGALLNDENILPEDKTAVIASYIKDNYSNLPPEEYAKAVIELTSEYRAEDEEQAAALYLIALKSANSAEQRQALVGSDNLYAQMNNSLNVNEFNEEETLILANTNEALIEKRVEGADQIGDLRLECSDDEHAYMTSGIDSASASEYVQQAHQNRAFRVKDSAMQLHMLNNTFDNSSLEVRQDAAMKLQNAHKDNRSPLAKKASEDKDVATYMNENGAVAKYEDADDQKAVFNILNRRFYEDDFTEDEAISQLNTLADQIQDCDKSNQLEMHNTMMSSKYSEVQEHTAANIGNYDESVKADALCSVYESGNEKAIENAVDSLKYVTDTSAQSDLAAQIRDEVSYYVIVNEAVKSNPNILTETSSDTLTKDKDSIQAKIASGAALTDDELASLTPSEKLQYYSNYFKNLPIEQKIKFLDSIGTASMKKTAYILLARTNSSLFSLICARDGFSVADSLLSMGLSEDVENKIKEMIRASAPINYSARQVAEKYGLEYNNEDTENNFTALEGLNDVNDGIPTSKTLAYSKYVSPPGSGLGGEKFACFPKDKNNKLLA